MLTDDAIENGVQSTTRYRKSGTGRRTLGHGIPAAQRQRSGARGGRAARRGARQRREEQSTITNLTSSSSPITPPYSDVSGCQSFDYHDRHGRAYRSWPMTPADGNQHLADDAIRYISLSPRSPLSFNLQQTGYADEHLHSQNTLSRSTQDQSLSEIAGYHAE